MAYAVALDGLTRSHARQRENLERDSTIWRIEPCTPKPIKNYSEPLACIEEWVVDTVELNDFERQELTDLTKRDRSSSAKDIQIAIKNECGSQ